MAEKSIHIAGWKFFCLFLSGFFFGGALDHVLFAWAGKKTSHYGLEIGVTGNWLMALLDLGIAALLFVLFKKK